MVVGTVITAEVISESSRPPGRNPCEKSVV